MPDITVTFEDGKQHVYQNVPDTIAPDDVYGRAQKDFPDQKLTGIAKGGGQPRGGEPESIRLSDVPGKALLNAPASAGKFATGLYEAVTSPVQTAKSLADLAAGGMRAGVQALAPNVVKFIDQIDNPETTKRISDTASAVGGQLAADYGSYENIKRKVATDPVGAMADLSTILTGGAMAAGRVAPKVANTLATAAGYTDPLSLTLKAGASGVNAFNKVSDVARAGVPAAASDLAAKVSSPFVGPTDTLQAAKYAQYGDLQEMAKAVQAARATPVLPGAAERTVSESLAVMGQPNVGLTGLEASLAGANPKMAADAFARRNQNIEAIQRQLAGLDEQIKTQAGALTPAATAEIKTVRDSLLRNLADEEQALANTAQGVARPLPNVSQSEVGGGLRSRGQALETETQRQVITPAYEKSFDASKNAPIDLTGMIGAAKRITNDLGSLFDASTVPESVRKTLRLEPSTTPGEWVQIAPGAGYAKPSVEGPPQLSLRDFDTVRKALNRERTAAINSNAPDAAVRERNIKSVLTQMDADLAKSGVPDAAKTLYGDALKLFQTEMVPSFRTGETAKMLSEGQFNMPATLPSKQVAAFLGTEEGATQFVRTFGKDAQALEGMKQGVLDLYRRGIVDATTRAVSPTKAAAFETKYARQLAALEKAGVNVRGTMAQVRGDAEIVQRGMETLASEAKKFRDAVNAKDVVDLALKSSSDMNFVKQRLTPPARQALVAEVTDRATQFIKDGAPKKALEYLTENERAIKTALGKGDKSYAQIVDLAKNQTELAELFKSAPTSEMITPGNLAALKPGDLVKLETVANEIKLMRQQDAMTRATGTKESGAKVATELAEQVGVAPREMPSLFMPSYTLAKNMLGRVVGVMNKKTTQTMMRTLIENPEEIIALAARMKAKTAAREAAQLPARTPVRALDIRVGPVGAAADRLNALAPSSDNRNAMAR